MYLKSIEVQGFKSFANKINFQFHNGITAIVGPNGSGKSNVADAVRWVLGEQRSKQLRGASMQDVIFSGTETRKPLSYAYVAITLDNRDHQLAIDYEEVTVARRLYRSGESEYLINGSTCRLKDVNELFYDTGIGKEGYSIIGQGQIDKILSGKPEEKRELFDEAAGIVKFKRRKATAEKKLEEEKQNLIRVKDILSELEKQLYPLEKQSEKAKIYLKKKEALKELDVNLFLLENERLKEQLEKVETSLFVVEEDLSTVNKRYDEIKLEYDLIQEQLENLEFALEETRTTLTDTSILRGKLEGEIKVLEEQMKSADQRDDNLCGRKKIVESDILEKRREKEELLNRKEELDQEVKEAQRLKEEASSSLLELQHSIDAFNSSIEEGKNRIITALNERATIKAKVSRLDSMIEQTNIKKAELNSKFFVVKSDEQKQDTLILDLEEEFEKIGIRIKELQNKQAITEEGLEQVKENLISLDHEMRDKEVLYHQEKSKLDALSNLTERYEGYGGAVKKIMEQRDREKGIAGVVADLIKVEKKYETAIETALGGSIQNVVTQDEDTAKRMIEYLKRNKAGRATFLPLTGIKNFGEFKNPLVLKEEGVIGTADSLVSTDIKYEVVIKSLLGRILVVDHIDHAVTIARKYDHSLRMVTIEGELLVPGGAISGGAFRNSSNLLGRRREMDELNTKITAYVKEIDLLLNNIERIKKERNKKRLELEEIKELLQKELIHQNTARHNIIAARKKQEETKSEADDIRNDTLTLEKQIGEILTSRTEILKELRNSEEIEKEIESSILEYQKKLEELRKEETIQNSIFSEKEVTLEKVLQSREFENLNLDRTLGELSKLEAELQDILKGLKELEEEKKLKEQNIEELKYTIESSQNSQSKSEMKLKNMMMQKEELSGKQKKFFEEREETSSRISALDKELYRLSTQKEKNREAIDHQMNYMWEEYEITLHEAALMKNPEMKDLNTMKKDIGNLKEEIRKLGDVNVNAIEDYKNIMERFSFLKTQHDDLIEAEKTLLDIISELDLAMKKQFQEKFAEISREFDKVFKELFGGGKGTLELMEEEDLLEAGIKIIAQPPGKKLQNMMQLSGGEKALTAIALLFAIQNLKPSPFCLLDEIEAALDENNVARYAKYLHKLTKETQFIVITHRRGTMERADRLYGITMQEKGVSTLVSVNLIEEEIKN